MKAVTAGNEKFCERNLSEGVYTKRTRKTAVK